MNEGISWHALAHSYDDSPGSDIINTVHQKTNFFNIGFMQTPSAEKFRFKTNYKYEYVFQAMLTQPHSCPGSKYGHNEGSWER